MSIQRALHSGGGLDFKETQDLILAAKQKAAKDHVPLDQALTSLVLASSKDEASAKQLATTILKAWSDSKGDRLAFEHAQPQSGILKVDSTCLAFVDEPMGGLCLKPSAGPVRSTDIRQADADFRRAFEGARQHLKKGGLHGDILVPTKAYYEAVDALLRRPGVSLSAKADALLAMKNDYFILHSQFLDLMSELLQQKGVSAFPAKLALVQRLHQQGAFQLDSDVKTLVFQAMGAHQVKLPEVLDAFKVLKKTTTIDDVFLERGLRAAFYATGSSFKDRWQVMTYMRETFPHDDPSHRQMVTDLVNHPSASYKEKKQALELLKQEHPFYSHEHEQLTRGVILDPALSFKDRMEALRHLQSTYAKDDYYVRDLALEAVKAGKPTAEDKLACAQFLNTLTPSIHMEVQALVAEIQQDPKASSKTKQAAQALL